MVFSFLNQKTENQIPIAAQNSKENNVSIKYISSTEPARISFVNRPTLGASSCCVIHFHPGPKLKKAVQ